MEPFGNRTSRKTDPLAAAISGEQVGNDTVGTELSGSFEESNAKFIHNRDRQFALEERNRVRTDVASNLISYGVATAGDYADFELAIIAPACRAEPDATRCCRLRSRDHSADHALRATSGQLEPE